MSGLTWFIIFLIFKNSDMINFGLFSIFSVTLYSITWKSLKDKLGNKESKCEQ